jgi:3-oxosteroid 1-dehydrogenase
MMGYEVPPEQLNEIPRIQAAGIVELCSPHTLVVNRAGRRFFDESYFQGMVSAIRQFDAMTHTHLNLPAFLIFDSRYLEKYSFADRPVGSTVPDWVVRDMSIAGLAAKLDIEADTLRATIERFNSFAKAGRDADFKRGELAWRLANEHLDAGKNQSLGTPVEPPLLWA